MKLNELKAPEGSKKKRTRVGRGIGSGKGKTCGRGHKGQKARTGVALKGFEGGQMPLDRRLPKFGFNNKRFATRYAEVNLDKLQAAIDAKKLDAAKKIDEQALVQAGVVRRLRDGVKLLGAGTLKSKVNLSVSKASKSAQQAVEKAGGTLTLLQKQAEAAGKEQAKK